MNLSTTATIVPDPSLADGLLNGHNADGALIVSMQYMPVFKRLIGEPIDERSVTSWHVSPQGARRIVAIGAWNSMAFHPTAGNA